MRMSAKTLPLMSAAFGLALALSLAGATGVHVQAQSQEPAQDAASDRADKARQRLQDVQQRLELTPEQAEQVRPVFVDELQQLKAIRDKYSGDQNRRTRLRMAREMRDVQQATDDKLKKILTSKQMDELKKIREEWRKQLRERADAQ